ncbi:hypothetical protein Sta7437_0784 [Stanieria cyanosphaera PCC 7437]|uniref:Acyltransferase n=1 Tax=Stanieria cyanosphaera (strain ATCC 29371 / PCC 7437) TaxID=111780 RepID=K9XP38_STAC7|nr:acyltransferase [Stanieria cyanosphaera]AFZ34375.1 hypothetical protein Sta7437_0784 [Stanieria cyanosphaera PCC 7437]
MILINKIKRKIIAVLAYCIEPVIQEIINNRIRVWGDPKRLKIASTASMVNTLFNTSSGYITIGDYTFTGHNVSIITGTHKYQSFLEERKTNVPCIGRDIVIGKGVWIGSNCVILGPATIGDHAVIAAGSVIIPKTNIPPAVIVGGIPGKIIKKIVKDDSLYFINQSNS